MNMSPNKALVKFKIIEPYLNEGESLTSISKQKDIAIRSLHRWVSLYKKYGFDGLKPKSRSDKGCYRKIPIQMVNMIEGLALHKNKKSMASIHRQISHYAKENALPIPSYAIVAKIVNNIPTDLNVLAHDGLDCYQQAYDLLFIREAQRPNHIWQADHTLLDIHILNEKDEIKRPWLTVIMDDYSRAIAGYYLSFSAPSSQQTSLTFRQAIWRKKEKDWLICGVPEILYTDHGSDFTSHHIEEVCASLKIQLIFSAVGKPRGRGKIERFFSTINQQLLESLPGYTQHKQPSQKNKFLTVEGLDAMIKSFILSDYNRQSHSSTKIEPNTRWQQNYFLPQLPESQEVLDLLLLTVAKPRTVHRQGIKFQGFRYLSPILAGYVGEKVIIRYDPRDMAEIRVFYQNKFLCRAFAQELESQSVSLKEIIKARNLRKKELQRNIKERRSLVDSILNIHPSVQEASKTQSCKEDKTQKPKKKSNTIKRYTNE